MTLPRAETVNYYKTGSSSPDTLVDKACKLIEEVGGIVRQRMVGMVDGREGVVVAFDLDGEYFRIGWQRRSCITRSSRAV